MKYLTAGRLVFALSVLAIASDVQGQTLFATPDTTPNYLAYTHIEECWAAGLRVSDAHKTRRDSLRFDTLSHEVAESFPKVILTKRPDVAIETAKVCLNKFNADTAKFLSTESAVRIVRILLVAHRDQDAGRLAQRLLDSLRRESEKNPDPTIRKQSLRDYKEGLWQLMREYGQAARPMRYEEATQCYRRLLSALVGDSLYYTIDAALDFMKSANPRGDSVAVDEAVRLAIRVNDSTPEEERLNSPGAVKRLQSLASLMARSTGGDALDSIAVSTVAYNLWYANTVKRRVYGGNIVTREEAAPKKMPEIGGAFYYVANNMSPDTLRRGFAAYSSKGAVPKGQIPFKNRINYFRAMPSLCHSQTVPRTTDDGSTRRLCWSFGYEIREFKREYPDIEIIGLSNTYGTVGELGPLKPAEEADTLAKLLLGWYHLPVYLVVENTEFFNLAAPDDRRIDLPTANSEAIGMPVMSSSLAIMTDKEGYMLRVPSMKEGWFKRFYEILKDRKSP